MEVMVPVVKGMDFDFNSARTSPYPTAPSTPTRVGEYYSAPTGPRHISDLYQEFEALLIQNGGLVDGSNSSLAEVPFDWEEKPGVPKWSISMYEDNFAFDVSGELQSSSLSAEELFDGGVIKPLPQVGPGFSQKSHKSPLAQGKKLIRGAFSRKEKKYVNPFGAAIEETRMREAERERGRERSYPGLSSSSKRAARSVSPIRVSEYQWGDEHKNAIKQSTDGPKTPPALTTSTLATFSKGFKWKLKDLFLFRSASDGRAMAKDPLKKYSSFIRKQEDLMNASLRSIHPRTRSTSSRRRENVSAHELHYTVNRAYSEDMKKKTFLPYNQGILGRLSFNPSVSYSQRFTRN